MSVTWTATAETVEWTSIEDPSVVFRFVATATTDGGGSFDGVHNDLDGRSAENAHPMSAITGLAAALAGKASAASVVTPMASAATTDLAKPSTREITVPEAISIELRATLTSAGCLCLAR